jgi:hypothetical protein
MAAATSEPAAGRVNHAAERRRRSYLMLDAANPARGRTVRWCEWALDFRRTGDVDKARALLRDALACGAHPPTIYRAWIAMEEEEGERAADAVRELFEGWRAWYPAAEAAGADDEGGFWCHYIAFEIRHGGGAARVRAVAERAVAACPRDPAVHTRYVRAEARLGCPDRARAVLESALDSFATDAEARYWLRKEEAAACGDAVSRGGWKRLRGLLLPFRRRRRGVRWFGSSAFAYEQLGVA